MEKQQQKRIAEDLLKDLSESIMKKIDRIPEEWDGHEIRLLIHNYYEAHYLIGDAMIGKRLKDFWNEVYSKDLI